MISYLAAYFPISVIRFPLSENRFHLPISENRITGIGKSFSCSDIDKSVDLPILEIRIYDIGKSHIGIDK